MAETGTDISGTLPYPAAIAGAAWVRSYAPAVLFYVAVTYFTAAFFMGDTGHYADVIAGSSLQAILFDFGHLLWMVLGWLLWNAIHVLAGGPDERAKLIFALIALSWAAGLIATLAVYDLALRVGRRFWVAAVVAATFVFSQAFLDFAHTGCAYVTGLALCLIGLRLFFHYEEKRSHSHWTGVGAGAAFACGVAVWFPYILALPGMFAAPFLLFGWSARRARYIARAAAASAIIAAVMYGSAAAAQDIHDPQTFIEWMSASSHGITTSGFSRMVFGFARSFINMGNDGVVFKRFMLHDPFNPVSLFDLMRISLGKFLLFYIFITVLLAALARSARGVGFLAFLSLSALPVIAFAWSWQGGDMERYFPFYPAVFLSLAYVLSEGAWRRVVRPAAALFLGFLIFINGEALGKTAADERQAAALARIGEIQHSWKPHSEIATVLAQDEVFAFYWNFPLHPMNLTGIMAQRPDGEPVVFDIVDRNSEQAPRWRETFASETLTVWSRGGDLWISKEAFAPRPRADSAWVEGDDPRVPWRDIHQFFSQLETGRSAGGETGFFLLPPSPANRERLAAAAKEN
jgi:hypothetical protein